MDQTSLPLVSWHSVSWTSCCFADHIIAVLFLSIQLLETSQHGLRPLHWAPEWNVQLLTWHCHQEVSGGYQCDISRTKHLTSLVPKHDVLPEFPISINDTIIHLLCQKKDMLDNFLTFTSMPSITKPCQSIEPPKYLINASVSPPSNCWLNQLHIFWYIQSLTKWSFFICAGFCITSSPPYSQWSQNAI